MEKKGKWGGWNPLRTAAIPKKIFFNIFFPCKKFIMWKLLTEKSIYIGE